MSVKIFFDMDGVLVDFSGGAADAIQHALDVGDVTKKAIRRLVNYDGPDREEPITAEFLDNTVAIKDAKGERTKWMKRVSDAVFSIVGSGGHPYWSSLPALPSYQTMIQTAVDLVGLENVYVCTAPVFDKTGGCESGKREWIAEHTEILPENVFVTSDKGSVTTMFPNSTNILIDDRKKYCDAWNGMGGISIRHSSSNTADTISNLRLIVNSHKS